MAAKIHQKNEDISILSFPGATINNLVSYSKPSVDKKPNKIIIDCGTNDLKSNKFDIEIATEIITLAKTIASKDIKVCVSGLIARGDMLEEKRVKTDLILSDMCCEEMITFMDNQNIEADRHLNRSNLHLNRNGDSILANNILKASRI